MSTHITQSDWDGVYYDRQSSEFFMMDVGDDGVTLVDAFSGDDYETLSFEEFDDCVDYDDFDAVSQETLNNPAETAQKLLFEAINAVSGGSMSFSYFDPVDADFAIAAVNLSFDEDAAYRQHLDE